MNGTLLTIGMRQQQHKRKGENGKRGVQDML